MIPVVCRVCGNKFIAKRRRLCDECQQHNRNSHKARTTRRENHDIQFIGVDGEGVNRPDGTHEYILLSVGNQSLYNPDGSRLTFYDIIPFLWRCFQHAPDASYVGFYLGYDFTQWVRDLPENRARMLFDQKYIEKRKRTRSGDNHLPFPVEHRGWYFDILGMKRFRLYREGSNRRMYICDAGSFFQTSFLNAIDPKKWPDGPIVTPEEYKLITIGKSERGQDIIEHGTPVDSEMLQYNILENDVLNRLMTRYNEGLVNVGIRLKRDQWFGPGQAAQTWMKNINAPTRKDFEDVTPLEIRHALRSSYYGGWFEIFAHGHIPGTSWTYDINSAYPDIQSRLPCCLHGKWTKGTELDAHERATDFTLLLCTISGSNDLCGAGMHRLRTGHILRPKKTKGWYWWPEIKAGIDAGVINDINIEQWITYEPCNCASPFTNERELYRDRLRVGKDTIGGKARKLVYNSSYGKTAQSIGTAKYANPFYASLITSGCRTRILEAISTHSVGVSNVLMVATDGICFRTRHGNIDLDSSALGKFTEDRKQNLTLFMPGIYWDDATRGRLKYGEHPTLKSRGIPAKMLANKIFEIDDMFSTPFAGHGLPQLDLEINFSIVSPKQALARNKWETCGVVSFNDNRHINSDPSMKRVPALYKDGDIIRSMVYETGFGNIESTPYNRTFGDEELKELDDLLTPDGGINMLFPETLR